MIKLSYGVVKLHIWSSYPTEHGVVKLHIWSSYPTEHGVVKLHIWSSYPTEPLNHLNPWTELLQFLEFE